MNMGRSGAERVLGEDRATLQAGTLVREVPALTANFSAGFTVALPGDNPDSRWQRADRGLYAATASGRGCNVVMNPPESITATVERQRRDTA